MARHELGFRLITPQGRLYDGLAAEVIVPAVRGDISLMPGHMPLIASVGRGVVGVRRTPEDRDRHTAYFFAVTGGVVTITPEGATLAAEQGTAVASLSAGHEALERMDEPLEAGEEAFERR